MGKQLGFYFEQKHCVGCKTCQVACKDKNDLAVGQLFRQVHEFCGGGYVVKGTTVVPEVYVFWSSMSCNHCQKPTCIEACPTGALQKQATDGIVLIDSKRCIGCRRCLQSCPYDALQYNPSTKKMGKCDFCRDLLAVGQPPTCVSACPMRVLEYGPLDMLQEKYGTVNQTKGMPSGDKTQPSLVISPHAHSQLPKANSVTKVP